MFYCSIYSFIQNFKYPVYIFLFKVFEPIESDLVLSFVDILHLKLVLLGEFFKIPRCNREPNISQERVRIAEHNTPIAEHMEADSQARIFSISDQGDISTLLCFFLKHISNLICIHYAVSSIGQCSIYSN